MNKRKISLLDIAIHITLLCNLGILLGRPLQIDLLVSLATRIMIITVFICAIIEFVFQISKRKVKKPTFYLLLLFITAVFFPLLDGVQILLNKYVFILCYLMIPSYAILCYEKVNTRILKKSIYGMNIIYWLVFLYLSKSNLSHIVYGEWGEFQDKALTLGFPNPNETGMVLLVPYIIMLCAFWDAHKKVAKLLLAIPLFHTLYMIILTESRICIILALLITIINVTKISLKLSKAWIYIVFALPMFVFILGIIFPDFVKSLIILGETADTGRGMIWSVFFQTTSFFRLLVGNLSVYAGNNMHNSYLSIIATYGLCGFIFNYASIKSVFIYYFYRLDKKVNGQKIAFTGMLGVILHGCVEATFLVSGSVYAGLAGLLFILALPERNRE